MSPTEIMLSIKMHESVSLTKKKSDSKTMSNWLWLFPFGMVSRDNISTLLLGVIELKCDINWVGAVSWIVSEVKRCEELENRKSLIILENGFLRYHDVWIRSKYTFDSNAWYHWDIFKPNIKLFAWCEIHWIYFHVLTFFSSHLLEYHQKNWVPKSNSKIFIKF